MRWTYQITDWTIAKLHPINLVIITLSHVWNTRARKLLFSYANSSILGGEPHSEATLLHGFGFLHLFFQIVVDYECQPVL